MAAVLSDTSDMLRISWNGTVGYVLKTDAHVLTKSEYEQMFGTITPTPYVTPSDHTPIPGTVILGYIKLIKEGVNLRETPNGETLTPDSADWLHKSTILPYYAMPVEKAGYNWIYVKYKDMYGYIRSDCYEITSTPDVTPTPTAEPVLGGYVRLIKSGVNMRKGPGTQYGLADSGLKSGTALTVYLKDGDWYFLRVDATGKYGYIFGDYVELLDDDDPTPKPTATPTEEPVIRLSQGDVNGDGLISAADVALILRYDAGLIDLSDAQEDAADMDGDKQVTSNDARELLKYISGRLAR